MPSLQKLIGLDDEQIKIHAARYGILATALGLGLLITTGAAYYYLGQRVELIALIMDAHASNLSELQPIRNETLAAAQAMKAIGGILTTAFNCAAFFSAAAALIIIHEGLLYRKLAKLLK
jgi:hypothetical protein